jgi:hypothetical protein
VPKAAGVEVTGLALHAVDQALQRLQVRCLDGLVGKSDVAELDDVPGAQWLLPPVDDEQAHRTGHLIVRIRPNTATRAA